LHACEGWKRVFEARACKRVRLFAGANDMRRRGGMQGIWDSERRRERGANLGRGAMAMLQVGARIRHA